MLGTSEYTMEDHAWKMVMVMAMVMAMVMVMVTMVVIAHEVNVPYKASHPIWRFGSTSAQEAQPYPLTLSNAR